MSDITNTDLYRITPEGQVNSIANEFGAIRDALDGQPFDFVYVHPEVGFYVDDEGMLNGSKLNLVASLTAGRALYGTVVLSKGDTDAEGETLPPKTEVIDYVKHYAHLWRHVVADAERLGQNVLPTANEATVPPPVITTFASDDEFFAFLEGRANE
jgi:GTP-dependent phosphoenolpyruvate carboxykinase